MVNKTEVSAVWELCGGGCMDVCVWMHVSHGMSEISTDNWPLQVDKHSILCIHRQATGGQEKIAEEVVYIIIVWQTSKVCTAAQIVVQHNLAFHEKVTLTEK